jgi:hypothetical protein
MKRFIKIFLLSFAALVFITGISAYVLAYIYKDQAIDYIVNKGLTKYLNAEVSVSKVDLTFFKSFPLASLQFNDAVCKSSKTFNKKDFPRQNTDTLFSSKKLYLDFNVWDLIKKNYTIKNIRMQDGSVSLYFDGKGENNFQILKKKEKEEKGNFRLSLHNVRLNNMKLRIIDLKNNYKETSLLQKIHFKGNFSDKEFELKVSATMHHYQLLVNKESYLPNQEIRFSISSQVKDKSFQVKKGSLSLDKIKLLINGSLNIGKGWDANLVIAAKKIKLADLMQSIPAKYKSKTEAYTSGIASFVINFNKNHYSAFPHIEAKFNLEDASFTIKQNNSKINNIAVNGQYNNGKLNCAATSSLLINSLSANMDHSKINAKGKIENFITPFYQLAGTTEINLEEIKPFFKIDTFSTFKGFAEVSFSLSGKLENLENIPLKSIVNSNTNAFIKLKECYFKLKNSELNLANVNGQFRINRDAKIEGLSFLLNNNDFLLNGTAKNIINCLHSDSVPLVIDGSLSSSDLNLDNYLSKSNERSEKPFIISFPNKLYCNVSFSVGKFNYKTFDATKVRCNLNYKPGFLTIRSLTLHSMRGSMSGGGALIRKLDDHLAIQCQLKMNQVEIGDMFRTFNNFGQKYLLAKHLKGYLNGNCTMSSEWTKELKLVPEKLTVEGSYEIRNGELIGFEPMMGLSKFARIEELKHIRFSNLKNDIYIKDKQIIIPQMDIHSSAFDLSGSGVHGFDNHFSYRVKMLLSQVLFKNATAAKKENSEFGEVEDDNLGKTALYFIIEGTPENYKIRYDTKKAKQVIVEKFKDEKKNLKKILHEEFGWFKNDTSIAPAIEPQTKKPRFNWDDGSQPANKNTKNEKKKQKDDNAVKVEWEDQ